MAGLEGVIRPFMGEPVGPQPFHPDNAQGAPPVRLSVGLVGGSKIFPTSASATTSTYMAAVHTEASSTAFDMASGQLN